MDIKKRMYFFDGRSILMDNYDESIKFDQNFDETNFKKEVDNKNTLMQSSMSMDNMKNFMLSGKEYTKIKNEAILERSSDNFRETNNQMNIYENQPNLLSEALINSLKDQYQKT